MREKIGELAFIYERRLDQPGFLTPLIEKDLPFRYKCFTTNYLSRNGEAE
jgi:hypothetical protein